MWHVWGRRVFFGKPERKFLEDIDLDEGIILKWVLKKCNGRAWTAFIWLRMWTGEHENESSVAEKRKEFLDLLRN
jgi:hypothetical protein